MFLKTSKLPNKKGTFDVNPVFIATLACTKKSTFHHKKGHFLSFEKIGGGARAPCAPPVPTPLKRNILVHEYVAFMCTCRAKTDKHGNEAIEEKEQ